MNLASQRKVSRLTGCGFKYSPHMVGTVARARGIRPDGNSWFSSRNVYAYHLRLIENRLTCSWHLRGTDALVAQCRVAPRPMPHRRRLHRFTLAPLSATHLRSAPLTSRLGGESSALPPSLHHVLGTPELVTACSVRVEHVGHPACELRLQKHWRLSGKLSSRLDLAVLPGANQVEVLLCPGGPTV